MAQGTHGEETPHSGCMKRKSYFSEPVGPSVSKRVRWETSGLFAPPSTICHLPSGIWCRILTLVPPRTLGCLMAVSKRLHGLLSPAASAANDDSQTWKADAIWKASRRRFWPSMPAPLKGKSELDMWRLCCSRSCQFYGTRQRSDGGGSPDPWHLGPGSSGVSPVFPFSFVACGRCLSENIKKSQLVSPPIPSNLLAGLTTAFVTHELHVIPRQLLATAAAPLNSQVAVVFFSEHVKAIFAEYSGVKMLGDAAAETWVDGLEARGKRLVANALRWEHWHLDGGVQDMRNSLQGLHLLPQKTAPDVTAELLDAEVSVDGSRIGNAIENQQLSSGAQFLAKKRPVAKTVAAGRVPRSADQRKPFGKESTRLGVPEKAEDMRQVFLSDRPSSANSLGCQSYISATIDASAPLDKGVCKSMEGRLFRHAEAAVQPQRENPAPNVSRIGNTGASGANPASHQFTSHVIQKDEDAARKHLRDSLSAFADDIMSRSWGVGARLPQQKVSRLVVEGLLYVRKKFYSDFVRDTAAAPTAAHKAKADPPGSGGERLTLEDMKWIFDNKILPHTKGYDKKFFFCASCEPDRRAFCLQGIVTHYEAKHAAVLRPGKPAAAPKSRKTSIWKEDWPATPMFVWDQSCSGANAECSKQGQKVSRLVHIGGNVEAIWRRIAHIPDVSNPTKAQFILHYIVARYEMEFSERVSLSILIGGLSHCKAMRPAGQIKGLQCKACGSSNGVEAETKLRTLLQLLEHFQNKHTQGARGQQGVEPHNWHVSVIRNSDSRAFYQLHNCLEKSDAALRMTMNALLWGLLLGRQVQAPEAPTSALPPQRPIYNAGNSSHGLSTDPLLWGRQIQTSNAPISALPQQAPVFDVGKTPYGPSQATGVPQGRDRVIAPIRRYVPEYEHATVTSMDANSWSDFAYDRREGPDMPPTRAVHWATDSPQKSLARCDTLPRGLIHHVWPSDSSFRSVDGEEHQLPVLAPYAWLYEDDFATMNRPAPHLQSRPGLVSGNVARPALPPGPRPWTYPVGVNHAGSRE